MLIDRLFSITRVVVLIGIAVSLVSLFTPLFINAEDVSASGQIASAFAGIAGITVASIALWAYIQREDLRNRLSEERFAAAQRLQAELHIAADQMELISEKFNSDILTEGLVIMLADSLANARIHDVFGALRSEGHVDAVKALILMDCTTRSQVRKQVFELDPPMFFGVLSGIRALKQITLKGVQYNAQPAINAKALALLEDMVRTLSNP